MLMNKLTKDKINFFLCCLEGLHSLCELLSLIPLYVKAAILFFQHNNKFRVNCVANMLVMLCRGCIYTRPKEWLRTQPKERHYRAWAKTFHPPKITHFGFSPKFRFFHQLFPVQKYVFVRITLYVFSIIPLLFFIIAENKCYL